MYPITGYLTPVFKTTLSVADRNCKASSVVAGVQQLTSLDLVLQPLVADRQIKRVATAAA